MSLASSAALLSLGENGDVPFLRQTRNHWYMFLGNGIQRCICMLGKE